MQEITSKNASNEYKKTKEKIMNNDKHYIYFEVVIGEEQGINDMDFSNASIENVANFYSMLKEEIQQIKNQYPIIPILAKALEKTTESLEVEVEGDEE